MTRRIVINQFKFRIIMKNITVSVVVPIYNVEKYLPQCLDSLLSQTLTNMEFILVNDGSADNSQKIIDEYAKKDPRIVAITQKNQGYGKAVNNGLSYAQGEYVAILESDDWVEPTMYEKLYCAASVNSAEISRCGFFIYNSLVKSSDQNIVWDEVQELFTLPNGIINPLDNKRVFMFHSALWTYIYKRDFIKEIKLNETSRSYQDYPFIFEVLAKTKRMIIVKECLHHYRMEQGQGSSSMTKSTRSMQMFDMTEYALKRLIATGTLSKIRKEFIQHSVLANQYFYNQTPDLYQHIYAEKLKKFFKEFDLCLFEGLPKDSIDWLEKIGVIKEKKINIIKKLFLFINKE